MNFSAIILAAGQGKRLRPYTSGRPKGTVQLAGQSLIERQIGSLRAAGAQEITFVGGYAAERLAPFGCPVIVNHDFAQTNMVASLACARSLFDGTRDLVISYSDIVTAPDVVRGLFHEDGDVVVASDRNWQALWAARMEDPLTDAESFEVDAGGNILELGRKASDVEDVQGQFIGLIRIPAAAQSDFFETWDSLDPDQAYEGHRPSSLYLTGYLQLLINAGRKLRPAWISGGWIEIDSVTDLQNYHAMLRNGTLQTILNIEAVGGAAIPDATCMAGYGDYVRKRRADLGESQIESDLIRPADIVARLHSMTIADADTFAQLDLLSRKIEIAGRVAEAYLPDFSRPDADAADLPVSEVELLLAYMLLHVHWLGDIRFLNTVLKALDGPLRTRYSELDADGTLAFWADELVAKM